jgi:signal transduction histidine kinase/CheY-like chemotaxis protein
MVLLSACGKQADQPRAVKGILDLSDWHFEKNGPAELRGEFEFYWKSLIYPGEFEITAHQAAKQYLSVHSYWNGTMVSGNKVPGAGYATYRLRVRLPAPMSRGGLKILDIGTAFKVFANGVKILETGHVSEIASESKPDSRPQVVTFAVDSSELDLVFHVSNFHHWKGGIWEPLKFGQPRQVHELRERQLAFDLTFFGALTLIGLYHLALFSFRTGERASLYLSLFCFLIASRTLTTVERYLTQIFPGIGWELLIKLEYASFYLAIPVFGAFLYALFRQEFNKVVFRVVCVVGGLAGLIVIVTPVLVFSRTLEYVQIFALFCFLYGTYSLIMAAKRKREGAWIILLGYAVLTIICVNDMLDASGLITTGYYAQFGLAIFVFTQACLLSYRFSQAFTTVDSQHRELGSAYQKLREEMIHREKTERENAGLHEKLSRAQKMEAIGLLAGGVAHDLNNILSGTVTYPDYLLSELPPGDHLRPALETIRDAGLKAAAIVQDLLTLARRSIINKRPMDLNKVVESYFASPEFALLKSNHELLDVEFDLAEDLYYIQGSEIHLGKALMNLINNAAEAQSRAGRIEIRTSNQCIDLTLRGFEEIPMGSYAVLTIKDEGNGIAEDDLKKIFEPFYTRKVMGQSGTGLGMSVVWGTVHDHDGYINVKSALGRGTVFEIFLPITKELPTASLSKASPAEYLGNGENILVVDDDPQQLHIASSVLRSLGYQVKTASSGLEAISLVEKYKPDLILLDMIMEPGYDGLETYERILKIRPGMKALIASGYSETDRVKEAQRLGAGAYIRKPYTLERIGMAIRTELYGLPRSDTEAVKPRAESRRTE